MIRGLQEKLTSNAAHYFALALCGDVFDRRLAVDARDQ